MKKLSLIILILFHVQFLFAAFPKPSATDSSQGILAGAQQQLFESFRTMKLKEYEQITGKKLNLKEKLGYKLMQRHYRKRQDIELHKGTVWSAVGGFFLGLILLPIGVLIAYLFSKDKTLRTWTWIGFGVGIFFYLFLAAVGSALGGWH